MPNKHSDFFMPGFYVLYTLDVVFWQISTFLEDSVAVVYGIQGIGITEK